MARQGPTELILVMARWCPHCNPLSVNRAERLSRTLRVPLRLLDIDVPEQELEADRLVEEFGDWTANYLIPQFFVREGDGKIRHLLTGVAGSVKGTERAWEKLQEELPREYRAG